MAATKVRAEQINSVKRADMDTTTSSAAVITKVIAGTNVTISSTGTDIGTGDVTINATGGGSSPLTTKGDIHGYDSANNRIPVGADGSALVADSSNALGVSYSFGMLNRMVLGV